jgi:hypothetical protein
MSRATGQIAWQRAADTVADRERWNVMNEAEWLTSTDPATMLRFITENPDHDYIDCVRSDRKLKMFVVACLAMSDQSMVNMDEYGYFDYGNEGEKIGSNPMDIVIDWASTQRVYDPSPEVKAHLLKEIMGNPWKKIPSPYILTCDICGGTESYTTHGGGLAGFEDWCNECRPEDGRKKRRMVLKPSAYITTTVLALAEAAYQERSAGGALDNARLAVLSDALEEAGCPREEIQATKRQRGFSCPKCGRKGTRRRGVGFEHEYRCPSAVCDAPAWEPDEEIEVKTTVPHPLLAHLRSPGPHTRGCWVLDLIRGKE